ncbi:MAG: sigma-70 family RNA polymerase sigma factor [Polyangiaceae bacterium]
MTTEDAALVERAASGDVSAFRSLYERHRADVARLVVRMHGNRSDLEDLVQEVFVQVHKSLRSYRRESKFSTWLHRVTVNVVLMFRRAAKSRPSLTEAIEDDRAPSASQIAPDDDAARRARFRAFQRVLDRVADKKRIVYVLHDLEGMSPAEISTIVDAPVLTVRTRLFYARREIAELLRSEPTLAEFHVDTEDAK